MHETDEGVLQAVHGEFGQSARGNVLQILKRMQGVASAGSVDGGEVGLCGLVELPRAALIGNHVGEAEDLAGPGKLRIGGLTDAEDEAEFKVQTHQPAQPKPRVKRVRHALLDHKAQLIVRQGRGDVREARTAVRRHLGNECLPTPAP